MRKILLGFIAVGLLTFVGCGTSKIEGSGVTDVDGNIYKSVIIGKQEWMSQNLNVDHFRNGDIIPEAKTEEEWEKAGEEKRPAWCYYDNDISNGKKYGKLYNWYAVNDPRKLAPWGWHVPTDADYTVLTDYLTADGHPLWRGGKALKSTSGWENKNDATTGNGTDDYGWNGLGGGDRSTNGSFSSGNFNGIGHVGGWWSSSEHGVGFAWSRDLLASFVGVGRYDPNKGNGFSVRCLRE